MTRFAPLLMLMTLAACNGYISDASPSGPGGIGPDGSPRACDGDPALTGRTALRRLTRLQYESSVRDALGLDALPSSAAAAIESIQDGNEGLFPNTTTGASRPEVSLYLDAGDAIATRVGADGLSSLVGCAIEDAGCAAQLVGSLGRRLFRRSLHADEESRYLALHTDLASTQGVEVAAEALLATMLASPAFLYREEPTTDAGDGGAPLLTDVAFASRLSFFLWQSGPDEALLSLAEDGGLSDPPTLDTELERMLEDPRARRGLAAFVDTWLGIDHVEGAIGDEALLHDMREETERFFQHVVLEGDGSLETLLTADYSYVSPELAAHYGIDAPTDASGFVTLPEERVGLLTQGAFLTAHGQFPRETRRGWQVRERLLCAPTLSLPAGVEIDETADRLAPGSPCVGCHGRMDTLGYAFEEFDALGAFRPEDARDVSPELVADTPALDPLAGPLADHHELADRLASSRAVLECMSMQWFSYAFGRPRTEADLCTLEALIEEFDASGGDIRALMLAITRSDAFRRQPEDTHSEGEAR